MKTPFLEKCQGYAWSFAIALLLLAIWSMLAGMASANGFRQKAACAVVHQQAVAAVAVPYPVIGYQVGQALQQQSVDEYGFRASPSQQRLTFLEGYFQAQQERLADSGDRPPGPHQPPSEGPDVTDGGQTNCEGCQVPESGTSEPQAFSAPAAFESTHPVLSGACSACHVDEQSKGGFGIAKAVVEAQSAADCETILAMVDSIATGAMPKGKPLSDADRLQAIAELLGK